MTDPLRERATRAWERNHERQIQLDTLRRLLSAFAFGVAITVLAVTAIETVARKVARPTTSSIERGLQQ